MNTFLLICASLAVASASVVHFSPTIYTAGIPLTTQYNIQDGLGQYSYFSALKEAELKAAEDSSNGENNSDVKQEGQQRNGSQKGQATMSRDSTSVETETPSEMNGSNESNSQQPTMNGGSMIADNGNGNTNGNDNGNGDGNGKGKGNGNGSNSISPIINNGLGLSSGLGLSGIGSSALNLNGDFNSALSRGDQLTSSGFNTLSSLQLNGISSDAFRFSEIAPTITSELGPISLTSVQVPTTSYLRSLTPTLGYNIVSPTVLNALPTLGDKSIQTISLPSTFLTKGLH